MTAANPLLDFSQLPAFDAIRAEHLTPALDVCLARARDAVAKAVAAETPATWADLVAPLDEGTEPLARVWSIASHLTSVAETPALRDAYGENLARISAFWSELGQNLALYNQYRKLAASPEYQALPATRKRIVDHALRAFRLGGAELDDAVKPRFAAISAELAATSKAFSDHVLDATNRYALWIDDAQRLAGLPADAIDAAREAAAADGRDGWKFTLHFPSYFPLQQYAHDRALRETAYRANVTRASELGPRYGNGDPGWDNAEPARTLLALRREQAQLLGMHNYGELSLVTKMADSPQQVAAFLDDIAQRAKPFAQRDLDELRAFAAQELGLETLQPWDIPYASEQLRIARYAFSEQEVKAYFPLPVVLKGLFGCIERLFGVTVAADSAPTWHPDVQFFRIENPDGTLVAQFYLDLYAREGKRSGAWMDDARTRVIHADGALQTPIAYLVCNCAPPVGGKPSLLTHDDVITLFHEFGHGLHHMLTEGIDYAVSGINGVEWDAVELPSQMLENFCWEWDVLQTMTAHVDTGAPLPRALYDKMVAAKNFQNGLMTLRQIVFSAFDMYLHTDYQTDGAESIIDASRAINDRYHVLPQFDESRWPMTFTHIFAGGYAAGYYSYKWAEVLSADAYAAFEEAAAAGAPILDPATGARYRREILATGGSRPALDSFVAFRGRPPQIDALLRHGGLVGPAVAG